MTELKYAKNIITDTRPPSPEFLKRKEEQKKSGSYIDSTILLRLDESRTKGAFYTDCVWLWDKHGTDAVATEEAHSHDFDEVIIFLGCKQENPRDLGGEIEFWIEDEQYLLTESCLIFVPKGIRHCPLAFRSINSPVLFITEGNTAMYQRTLEAMPEGFLSDKKDTTERKYAKNIITKYRSMPPEMEKRIAETPIKSTAMLWLDDQVAQGAFYTECHWLWIKTSTEPLKTEMTHTHDFDEVLGFIGSNRENPHDLGGEIELWIEDEKHIINKSCLVFVPRGTRHLPITFVRIDSPVMFFTEGNGSQYKRATEEKPE